MRVDFSASAFFDRRYIDQFGEVYQLIRALFKGVRELFFQAEAVHHQQFGFIQLLDVFGFGAPGVRRGGCGDAALHSHTVSHQLLQEELVGVDGGDDQGSFILWLGFAAAHDEQKQQHSQR